MARPLIWIGYTTRYREGGIRFAQVARTMAREKANEHPTCDVVSVAIDSRGALRDAMTEVKQRGGRIAELHLITHGGMYGPMFGSTAWPEQFSPHEWRNLSIPFTGDGRAHFHACRSARWFAPFFARTFGVPAHGYHWYTTFSAHRERFRWVSPLHSPSDRLYVFGCPGTKSHGALGFLRKYAGLTRAEPMQRFDPDQRVDSSYDPVADLYDETFSDIRVRDDEWRWINQRLINLPTHSPALLDIGCGNGALLRQLASSLSVGAGIDASPAMIERARSATEGLGNLQFDVVDGPCLPHADDSFDCVLSMLSFRYLDWDPIIEEALRVLKPGGRLLIVDMVASPARLAELPRLLGDKLREVHTRLRNPGFARNLERMVGDDRWRNMLQYNPIRAEHELRWYLGSRFPEGRIEVLNISQHARILSFDSGPIHDADPRRATRGPLDADPVRDPEGEDVHHAGDSLRDSLGGVEHRV